MPTQAAFIRERIARLAEEAPLARLRYDSELYGQSMMRSLRTSEALLSFYCWSVATVLVISPIIGFELGDKEEAHAARERSCGGIVVGTVKSNSAELLEFVPYDAARSVGLGWHQGAAQ